MSKYDIKELLAKQKEDKVRIAQLIAALKKCLKSVFDHDLEAYLYSPEYQAIKHLLEGGTDG